MAEDRPSSSARPAAPTEPEVPGDPSAAPPGRLGRFTIERPLGAGGMGLVFAARDATLGRSVAVKLVRPGAGSAERHARLLREAQALASLSHPNVVTVHDVGEVDGQIFIAMELIDSGEAGSTLRDWMATPRPWRDIAARFLAAGRGLAAVHAIGLVHRDFKPSNVLIDRSGAVKVGDFGVVAGEGDPGSSAGTPAYMAPEQKDGAPCDARSDQYSFCVSFREALTAGGRPIPRPLRALLERGLVEEPSRRHPSMAVLLAEVERVVRPARTGWIVAAVVGAATAAASIAFVLSRAPAVNPCPPPAGRLAGVWDAARRAAVRERLVAIDPERGRARFDVAAARLDAYTRAWSDMQVASCRATRVAGEQSDTMLDLRRRCLDRSLAGLREASDRLLAAADRPSIDGAVDGAARLETLDGCADTAALAQVVPPPVDPAARSEAERIAAEADEIGAARRAGRPAGLLDRATGLVARARKLDHAPTLVTALQALADTQLDAGDGAAGAATLREITQVAAVAHEDHAAAVAWSKMVLTVAWDLGKPDEALGLLAAAEAAVARAGSPLDLRVHLLYYGAQVHEETQRRGEALTELADARRLLEGAGARDPGSTLGPFLGDVIMETAMAQDGAGEHEKSLVTYREAIDVYRAVHGPDHPDEAYAWNNLGEALRRQGKSDDAIAAYREAIRIREARQGETTLLFGSYAGLASALEDAGRWDEALDSLQALARTAREKLGPDDLKRVSPLVGLATALKHEKRWDETRAIYDEVLAIYERTGARNANLAITLFNRGNVELDQDRWAASLEWYDRSTVVFEAVGGATNERLIYPLEAKGRALVMLGRPGEALAPLERALALGTPGRVTREQAAARFYRGRALVESGRDRRGGLADARAGRAALAAASPGDPELAAVDAWLAKH